MKPAPVFSLLCLVAIAAAAPVRAQGTPEAPPEAVRSLDQALRIAFTKSPALLQVNERLFRTRKTVEQIVGAARRPNISASATYTRLSGLGAAFGGGGFGASPSSIQNPFPVGLQTAPPGSAPVVLSGSGAPTRSRQTDPGDDTGGDQGGGGNFFGQANLDQQSVRFGVSQLIDLTGIVRASEQIGGIEEQIVLLEILRTRQETALTVKNGYYNVLRAEALVRVSEAAVAASTASLQVSESQLRAGTVAAFDVLRAKTQLANNQQSLISARNQLAIAKNAFANALGLDPSTPVDLPPLPAIAAQPDLPPLPDLTEATLLERARRQRPEAHQAALNEAKAKKATRLARRNLEPFASVSLSGNYNPNPALVANERSTGSLSVTLTTPIYDGGATKAGVESAHADERTAAIQTDQFLRGIKAEVQQAVIAVRDAEERARTAWASVEEARESFRLAGVRYREGVDTQLAVNDAQTALVQAETNAVNARFDYLAALARLTRAVGDPV